MKFHAAKGVGIVSSYMVETSQRQNKKTKKTKKTKKATEYRDGKLIRS